MTEKHALTAKEPSGIHEDWSTLIARAADDVSRIVQSEIHLFETTFRSALEGQINYALAGLAIVAVMICGTLCALAALILYAQSVAAVVASLCGRRLHHVGRRRRNSRDRLRSSLEDGGCVAA
jgi:hypothetical protein